MPLPNFLIIGETKCGTTSMYDNLVQHPQILSSKGNEKKVHTDDGFELGIKELRFFDRDWWKGYDWYRSRFPECQEGYITGEASPTYLYRTQALQRIASIMPKCRLIVMLRNPVGRLISHYNHLKRVHGSNRQQFNYDTLYDYWTRATEGDYYLIDKGIYWRSLETLFTYFDRENILLIRSETMFEDPQCIYSETLKFLGVDNMQLPAPSHSRKNRYRQPSKSIINEIGKFYNPHNIMLAGMLGVSWW